MLIDRMFLANLIPLLALLAVWDIAWKAVGLWHAARNGQKYWFVAMMLINSVGILPIVYLRFFQRKRAKN